MWIDANSQLTAPKDVQHILISGFKQQSLTTSEVSRKKHLRLFFPPIPEFLPEDQKYTNNKKKQILQTFNFWFLYGQTHLINPFTKKWQRMSRFSKQSWRLYFSLFRTSVLDQKESGLLFRGLSICIRKALLFKICTQRSFSVGIEICKTKGKKKYIWQKS